MEKKENYIILKIISVILILYFLNLYYDYYQIKKNNETLERLREMVRKSRENNQQFSPNYQTQTKEKNSSNNDYLRGMDWDKLSERNKEISKQTQEKLQENFKLNQNKESPKKITPFNCTSYKVGGIETLNCR
jgi:biopolymer transport protein ExbB/TolQ